MEYRSLGRTGVKVSALCLGCLMFGTRTRKMESIFGDQIGEVESMDIIDRAIDAGINFLDTANVVSPGDERGDCWQGAQEERSSRPDRTGD